MFKLEFKTDNAAFRDTETDELDAIRVVDYIADFLADGIASCLVNGETSGAISDINGNRCGSWSLAGD